MSNVSSASLAGLNAAVQQFEAAAARIANAPTLSPGAPLDSVEVVGSRAPGGAISAIADLTAARYSFAASAKTLAVIHQTQKALLDIKV
ncbi:MAG: hypothetical protein AB7O50_10480 [Pseudolabrys sp.]